jgi:hypothetical protein
LQARGAGAIEPIVDLRVKVDSVINDDGLMQFLVMAIARTNITAREQVQLQHRFLIWGNNKRTP